MNVWNSSRRNWVIVLVAGSLYLVACATPILDLTSTGAPNMHVINSGYEAALLGWLAVLVGLYVWFANPLFAAALLCIILRRPRIATVCALLALIISTELRRINAVRVPADEGGANTYVLHHVLIGCYFWYASLAVAFIGAVVLWLSPPLAPRQ